MDGVVALFRAVLALGLLGLAVSAEGADGLPGAGEQVGQPRSRSRLADFPGLRLEYHGVSGRTAAEIRASLNALGLIDPASGAPVAAYTEWSIDWWIPGRPDGECRLDQAKVTLEVTVGLPRLADPDAVSGEVLQNWQSFVAALEAHEATHVRHAYEGSEAVLRGIRGANCATAERVAEDAMDALRWRNEEFDRRTRHGQTEGAFFS